MTPFRTINLNLHSDIAETFRKDSYTLSFGHTQDFDNNYLQWLKGLIDRFSEGCVHYWYDNKIIGQIESQILTDRSPEEGYVNLFYIHPEFRGQGYGKLLDHYICDTFYKNSIHTIRARVSRDNKRALRFYEKMGWKIIKVDPQDPRLLRISKVLTQNK